MKTRPQLRHRPKCFSGVSLAVRTVFVWPASCVLIFLVFLLFFLFISSSFFHLPGRQIEKTRVTVISCQIRDCQKAYCRCYAQEGSNCSKTLVRYFFLSKLKKLSKAGKCVLQTLNGITFLQRCFQPTAHEGCYKDLEDLTDEQGKKLN